MIIGCHVSISRGFTKALLDAKTAGGNTMQFFSRNPRGLKAKRINENDILEFKKTAGFYRFDPILAHSPYTINLASNKDDSWELAQNIIFEDLDKLDLLDISYLVIHPGNHLGKGVDYGIDRIARGLKNILNASSSKTEILLETMAGSGTEVGSSFEEIASIIDFVGQDKSIGVCLDTCHIFCAGYHIDESIEDMLSDFDKIIGLKKLKSVHVNDSKNEKGSKKDRHANIGEGLISLEVFHNIMNCERLKGVPLVLETPGDIAIYKKEISMLMNMSGDGSSCSKE